MADTSKYIVGFTEGGEFRFGSSFLMAGVRISGPYIPDLPTNISFYHNNSAVSPSGKVAYIVKASPASDRMSQIYKIDGNQKKYLISPLLAPFPEALHDATEDSVEIEFSSFSFKNREWMNEYLNEPLKIKMKISDWYEPENFYRVSRSNSLNKLNYSSGSFKPQLNLFSNEYLSQPEASVDGQSFYVMVIDSTYARTKPFDFYGRLVRVDANEKTVKQIPIERRYSDPRILTLDNDRVLLKDKKPYGDLIFTEADFKEKTELESPA